MPCRFLANPRNYSIPVDDSVFVKQQRRSTNVLIVNCTPILCLEWSDALVSLGLSVECAHSLQAAERFVADTPNWLDYVIIDPDLPDGNGAQFLARLLEGEHPVVAAAAIDPRNLHSSLELAYYGAVVVPKPFSCSCIPLLVRILERHYVKRDGVMDFASKHHLSSLETQVLDAQLSGLSDKMIADALSATEHAINQTIRRIHKKLGVSTFREVVSQWRHFLTRSRTNILAEDAGREDDD